MTKRKLNLVTGASGKTARACLAHLIRKGARTRALVRRAEAADDLRAKGVSEVIVGDMFAPDVMKQALEGVESVLHICPPMHPQEDALAIDMMAACKTAGVGRFVLWSVLHPHINVPHHRRKQKAEAALIDSGLMFTILQPGRYMQHLESIWPQVFNAGIHAFPFSTSSRFSLAHLDDLARAAAEVMTNTGHENAIYELAGPEALSSEDCARQISEMLDRPVRAQAAPLDAFLAKARAAGMPDWRIETFDIMNRHYDGHGLQGNGNVLGWLIGRAPKTFRQYVSELAAR
ncbi:MAG: NAD(P)H-binding protein [Beijerinckiaceae bacterium]|nr:NAD(P)H-binding protein [Beijerinckiaceae bacterium]